MKVSVPRQIRGLHLVLAISGGKDSAACALAMREAGLDFTMAFADTGWESPVTYEHLDYLETKLGKIHRVKADMQMVGQIRHRKGFPSRMQRWCTRKLKIEPLRAFHDSLGDDTVNVAGIRGSESATRAAMPECEDDDKWGGWVWRPIIRWTVPMVLDIHHRHGVEVNPLYRDGHNRVGCYPCIYANKGDIRLVADNSPGRIEEIRQLEAEMSEVRGEATTFFQAKNPKLGIVDIDRVVAWARTPHGNTKRQLDILPPPNGGCFRWGMCDPPDEPK